MRVKIPKTKVVVFKKEPVLARNEQWTIGGQRLEVFNYFIGKFFICKLRMLDWLSIHYS